MKECRICRTEKPLEDFHKAKKGRLGRASKCKPCVSLEQRERYYNGGGKEKKAAYQKENPHVFAKSRAKWLSVPENREHDRAYGRRYGKENPEKCRIIQANYQARKAELPNDLTSGQVLTLHEWFGGSCALCDNPAEHLDHFIPLVSGHGGTIIENMIPLCAEMNLSKGGKNPFVWRSTLDSEAQKRFDDVVAYIAEINDLEPEGYEAYVNTCF